MSEIIRAIESEQLKKDLPKFNVGDTLRVMVKVVEGDRERLQAFEGICNNLERRYQETQSDASKKEIEGLMTPCPCPACQGKRLRPEALAAMHGSCRCLYEQQFSNESYVATLTRLVKELTDGEES